MEWMGYVAAALVFCTFYMRTMLPLRWMAVASNVAFLAYAIPLHLWPIAILHALLLPLNCLRLRQLYRMLANLRAAATQTIDVMQFLAHLTHHQHPAGAVLFSKGDCGDCAYYIANGEVEIPERHIRIGAGQFFGEIGVFGSSRTRTGSAVCASNVTLYRIGERDLISAFYQSPPLAFALVRLIVDRLGDNLQCAEQAVAGTAPGAPTRDPSPPVSAGPPSPRAAA